MSETPKKRGPRPRDPADVKRSYSLSLTPNESKNLEEQADANNETPSALIIRKLRLDKPRPPKS